MRHYTQLTREQRYQISALLDNNLTQTKIAKTIGFASVGLVHINNQPWKILGMKTPNEVLFEE